MVTIHRGLNLVAEVLAIEVRDNGFVAFSCSRLHQRELASEVKGLVAPDISTAEVDADSPNSCMCVIDIERHSMNDVLRRVAIRDRQDS